MLRLFSVSSNFWQWFQITVKDMDVNSDKDISLYGLLYHLFVSAFLYKRMGYLILIAK